MNISILHMKMAELPSGYEGETSLTDSMLEAKGFFGQKNYSFQTNKNLVKDFTVLGARIYQALAQGDDTAYREDESYYNTFVYSQDTELPASLETLFRKELGDGGNREQGHTDYYTAISRIRAYLEKNMTYSTATDVYTKKVILQKIYFQIKDRPQCSLCNSGSTDVPVLWNSIQVCRRISDHTGGYQR